MIAQPFDVLCQQLVGMAMTGLWSTRAAYDLIRNAAPFCELAWSDFQDCLDYLAGKQRDGTGWLPARIVIEADCFTIADERTAKLLRRNLGTILTEDACRIALRAPTAEDDANTKPLGEIDLAYAERLQPGDRFVLEGRCLEMKRREAGTLIVDEAFGRPQIPRWLGNGVPMPNELARRIYSVSHKPPTCCVMAMRRRNLAACGISSLRIGQRIARSLSAATGNVQRKSDVIVAVDRKRLNAIVQGIFCTHAAGTFSQ